MTNWSNDEMMTFLEAYRSEPCIWNPKDVNHKDKTKVAAAWCRLGQTLNKPVRELKAKKGILITTFRKHFLKKQEFIRSGAGDEDMYEPCWFAYQFMESFLKPVYSDKYPLNTERTKRRRRPAPNLGEQQMDTADEQLTNISERRLEHSPPPEEDDCDIYGKLTAKKLRDVPNDERRILMYQIDGLFIKRLNSTRDTPSP